MCGIVGFAGNGGGSTELLRKMCSAIKHRGPDDTGVKVWADDGVGLGHTRLSIIDLSAAGRNPMSNEDDTVWLVFNGEVYNYLSLRRELEELGHTFRSSSDTEVIVHAYEQWGDDHILRLRGMFAYALYDRRGSIAEGTHNSRGNRLVLVRDRLGVKPLFYYLSRNKFVFGSEIKAILALPEVDRSIDQTALFDYLTYLYIPTPKTAYVRIRKLEPGHFLIFENGDARIQKYWDVPLHQTNPVDNEAEAVEVVHKALLDAVSSHMVSDVQVGAFLSGGIDSSMVTALMAQSSAAPIATFTVGFDESQHSETAYARLVADHCRTTHREQIVGVGSVQEMLSRIVELYDEPYADGSAVPTFLLSSVAAAYVKVVLSGDGGDEVFAGYNWYSAWLKRRGFDRFPESVRRSCFAGLGAMWPGGWRGKQLVSDMALSGLQQYARLMELFSPAEKRDMLQPEARVEFEDYDDYWYFRQYWREDVDPLTRVQYLDLKTYLPDDILTKVDRASMAVSLEVRPPLLDHFLVETLFSIPPTFRIRNGSKKHLLKCVAKDYLPEPILKRSKKGFSAPWTAWMHTERDWVHARLAAPASETTFLKLNLNMMPRLFDSGLKVWALLLLQEWERREQVCATL